MSINAVTCPTCDDQLPEVGFNECGPDLQADGFIGLLLARPGNPFANIEDPAEHASRTNETSTAATAVRRLFGVGSYAPEYGSTFKVGRLTRYNQNTATVVFKVYDNNATNYEMARLLGCNTSFLVWRLDSNGNVYGGNNGISMVLNAREPMTEDLTGKKYIEIQGTYDYTNMDPRDEYPLFDELDGQI